MKRRLLHPTDSRADGDVRNDDSSKWYVLFPGAAAGVALIVMLLLVVTLMLGMLP